jgi:hypothetical protein
MLYALCSIESCAWKDFIVQLVTVFIPFFRQDGDANAGPS